MMTAPAKVQSGSTVSLEFTVINQGPVATAVPHWTDRVYLSLDNQVSGDDYLIGALDNGSALGPGESYRTQTAPFVIPKDYRGQAYLIVRADGSVRSLKPGESYVLWMKFPAPPAETKAITLQLPNMPPFEDLNIQD